MSKKPNPFFKSKEEKKEIKGGKYTGGPKEEKAEKKKGFVPFKKKR